MNQIGELNDACKALNGCVLGTTLNALITLTNELKADFNLTLTKIDTDTFPTDSNYSSLGIVTATDVDTLS